MAFDCKPHKHHCHTPKLQRIEKVWQTLKRHEGQRGEVGDMDTDLLKKEVLSFFLRVLKLVSSQMSPDYFAEFSACGRKSSSERRGKSPGSWSSLVWAGLEAKARYARAPPRCAPCSTTAAPGEAHSCCGHVAADSILNGTQSMSSLN